MFGEDLDYSNSITKSTVEGSMKEQVETSKVAEVRILVEYHPGKWGKVFHIFDLDNREIALQYKDACRLARSILKIAKER